MARLAIHLKPVRVCSWRTPISKAMRPRSGDDTMEVTTARGRELAGLSVNR
jgi:hypothetical protein